MRRGCVVFTIGSLGEYLLSFVLIPNHWLPFVRGKGRNNLCCPEKRYSVFYSSEVHDTVNYTCMVITEFFLVASIFFFFPFQYFVATVVSCFISHQVEHP